jgi:hypothetical protein
VKVTCVWRHESSFLDLTDLSDPSDVPRRGDAATEIFAMNSNGVGFGDRSTINNFLTIYHLVPP